jgi:Tol biopolymer transport system component
VPDGVVRVNDILAVVSHYFDDKALGEGAGFPGTNGKLAFQSSRTGNNEIFSMNADGSGQTNLTNNAAIDTFPAWSADGSKIAFTRVVGTNSEVYTMNADGSNQMRLTTNSTDDIDPTWSPDGTRIAFVATRDSDTEIYVMNADGSGQTRLTKSPGTDIAPSWSPDGTTIAFETTRDGNREVYVMNANGSALTNLSNNAAPDSHPNWSPDGAKIVFASIRDGNSEVYVMNATGTGQTRLTVNAANEQFPAWSPDGAKIAFKSDRDAGDVEVYVMNPDGSSQTNLTNSAGSDTTPDWQPIPVPKISITSTGQYALPRSCFEVRDTSQSPVFDVCDNDFDGAPETHYACFPDDTCSDDSATKGTVQLTVAGWDYRIVQSQAAPLHTAITTMQNCNASTGPCAATFVNAPTIRPWHPWDLTGGPGGVPDGVVRVNDILAVITHFFDDEPLN